MFRELWTSLTRNAAFLKDGGPNDERALLERLYAEAPEGCATASTQAIRNAAPELGEPLPVIFFSHCHGCTRFELFTVAEQLASYGFAVVAPWEAYLVTGDAEALGEALPTMLGFLGFGLDRRATAGGEGGRCDRSPHGEPAPAGPDGRGAAASDALPPGP